MSDSNSPQPDDGKRRSNNQNGQREMPLDILTGTEFEGRPEVDPETGEREPLYYVASETYLGTPPYRQYHEIGNKIVFFGIPNAALYPLNRAAAVNFVRWERSLPEARAIVDVGDMAEAAQLLAAQPEMLKLPRQDWDAALHAKAQELRIARVKREGGQVMSLPSIGHNFKVGPSNAPPMLGVRFARGGEPHTFSNYSNPAAPQPLGPQSVRPAAQAVLGPMPARAAMAHPGGR